MNVSLNVGPKLQVDLIIKHGKIFNPLKRKATYLNLLGIVSHYLHWVSYNVLRAKQKKSIRDHIYVVKRVKCINTCKNIHQYEKIFKARENIIGGNRGKYN